MQIKQFRTLIVLLLLLSATAVFGQAGSPLPILGTCMIEYQIDPSQEFPSDMVRITLINLDAGTIKNATLYTIPENHFGFDSDGYEQIGSLETGESTSLSIVLTGLTGKARKNGFELDLKYTDESGKKITTRVIFQMIEVVL